MQLRKMTEIEQQMYEDLMWADEAPEVMENPDHFGQFVVVHKKRILGFGRDRAALVQEIAAREQIPWRDLVVIIVPCPGLWEIPH